MDTLEAILTRRSARNYRKKDGEPGDASGRLSEAGHARTLRRPMSSPGISWSSTTRLLLEKIPSIHPYAGMVSQAPVAVLVCGDPGREKHAGMWVQDCAAATQNLLLAAHALGLGSVWVGVYPREERMQPLRKLLGIPERISPLPFCPWATPRDPWKPGRIASTRIAFARITGDQEANRTNKKRP